MTTTFKRDPRFTPASLTDHQLTRIERLADALVARNAKISTAFSKAEAEDLANWWINVCRGGFAHQRPLATQVRQWFNTDDDAYEYLLNCIKWVIVCGLNARKFSKRAPVTDRKAWAQIRGAY